MLSTNSGFRQEVGGIEGWTTPQLLEFPLIEDME